MIELTDEEYYNLLTQTELIDEVCRLNQDDLIISAHILPAISKIYKILVI